MALPTTVGSTETIPDENYFVGPIKAPNGNYYIVLEGSSDRCRVFKATDPTSSWTEKDPTPSSITWRPRFADSGWVFLSGSTIHISGYSSSLSQQYDWGWFDTSTDTYVGAADQIEAPTDSPTTESISIAVRSDGDQIALYTGDTDKEMGTVYDRCDYAREEGAGWTTGVNVGGDGLEEDHTAGVVVRGSSDNVHFFWFYQDTGGAGADYVAACTLDPTANTLSTTQTYTTNAPDAMWHAFAPGVYHDDGSNKRISVPFKDSNADISVITTIEDGSGDVGSLTYTSVYSSEDVKEANSTPVACGAIDLGSDKMYILWASNADSNIARSDAATPHTSGWSTTTDMLSGTINRLGCNIYPRNGSLKLAYVYDDGGTTKYNEYDIGQETAPGYASARLPQQNYSIGPFSV